MHSPNVMNALLQQFSDTLVSHGLAPNTVRGYMSVLNMLQKSIGAIDLRAATSDDLLKFISAEGLMPSTHFQRRCRVHVFYKWLHDEVIRSPASRLPRQRRSKTLPKNVMSKWEAQRVLEQLPSDSQ